MEKLSLLDVVVLLENLPIPNLKRGALGAIVEDFENDTFLVEFADTKGVTYAMPLLKSNQLMKVHYEAVEV
jgi:Domain of unknown function (DUF4926)